MDEKQELINSSLNLFPDWSRDWVKKRLSGEAVIEWHDILLVKDWINWAVLNKHRFQYKLYKISWKQAMINQEKYHDKLKKQKLKNVDGADKVKTYLECANNYRWVIVHSDGLQYEGTAMGHCVGSYVKQVEDGVTIIFSLRDHKNMPHVTIEYDVETRNIQQGQCKGNSKIKKQYMTYVLEFLNVCKFNHCLMHTDVRFYVVDGKVKQYSGGPIENGSSLLGYWSINKNDICNFLNRKIYSMNSIMLTDIEDVELTSSFMMSSLHMKNCKNIKVSGKKVNINIDQCMNIDLSHCIIEDELNIQRSRIVFPEKAGNMLRMENMECDSFPSGYKNYWCYDVKNVKEIKDLDISSGTFHRFPDLKSISNIKAKDLSVTGSQNLENITDCQTEHLYIDQCPALPCSEMAKGVSHVATVYGEKNGVTQLYHLNELTEGMTLHGNLTITDNEYFTLKKIPDNIRIHGHLYIDNVDITEIGNNMRASYSIHISNCNELVKIGDMQCEFSQTIESCKQLSDIGNLVSGDTIELEHLPSLKYANGLTSNKKFSDYSEHYKHGYPSICLNDLPNFHGFNQAPDAERISISNMPAFDIEAHDLSLIEYIQIDNCITRNTTQKRLLKQMNDGIQSVSDLFQ